MGLVSPVGANGSEVTRSDPQMSHLAGLSFTAMELTFHLGQLPHQCTLLIWEEGRDSGYGGAHPSTSPPRLRLVLPPCRLQAGTREHCHLE